MEMSVATPTIQDFFSVLFDEGESTCFSWDAKGTKVYPISSADPAKFAFFCINPLDPDKDNFPYEKYHRADKPRRCDKNVMKYRNILIEMDNIELKAQVEKMKEVGL